jgi:hypothetical protein
MRGLYRHDYRHDPKEYPLEGRQRLRRVRGRDLRNLEIVDRELLHVRRAREPTVAKSL